MVTRFFCFLLSTILIAGCGDGIDRSDAGSGTSSGGGSATIDCTPLASGFKRIFVTASSYTGAFRTHGFGITGVEGADTVCDRDTNNPQRNCSRYKALIADGSNRYACSTANCGGGVIENTDWVLQASTQYRRVDGTTVIGTTTAAGIFSYPVTNGFAATADDVWTGSWTQGDWTSGQNCSDWSDGTGGVLGSYGANPSATDKYIMVDDSDASCGISKKLYCVEQ